ncbi:MAG: RNA polymerase sigma-54 factor, partial [Candidatus Rokuibacteriota bacterium]
PTPAPSEPPSKETSSVDGERADELPFDLSAAIFDEPDERTPVSTEEREDLPFENLSGNEAPSLADHLLEQLRLSTNDPRIVCIGEAIIGNLDEDGYLQAELSEIAAGTGSALEAVEATLRIVQAFDPRGVAARSVQECLLLQITADPEPDPVSVEILEQYFEDLGRRRYAEIARAMKLPLDRIMESVEEIQGLEPKPGRSFGSNDSRYIVPDVTIQKVGQDYVVILNEEGIPRLRVNSLYRSLLRRSGDEAKQYVEQKIRSALWLIKSVEQRQRTLRRVAQSLVNFQRDFLDKGLPHLRPLALRDVGDDISMHESTISRVTTNKYVQTPQGLFELKFFFHSGIASNSGGMVSSVSVKKMIRDMVEAESATSPRSDQEIAQELHKQGLTIARRTVAKYREELGILPSHQRRLQQKKR